MDNKIVSTTYVPLQPPYQIIKYTGDIAMQIGTLIVTIQKEGSVNGLGYAIETHSHPVVSYENKFKSEPNRQLSNYHFLEGAVWNNVEVKDVTTICLTNARLPWQEFIDFLWRDIYRRLCVAQPTVDAYWSLDKLCGGVGLPEIRKYVVNLHSDIHYQDNSNTPIVRSDYKDIFALNAIAIDEEAMMAVIHSQIDKYIWVLQSINKALNIEELTITYETNDEKLRPLVDSLNKNRRYRKPLAPLHSDDNIGTLTFGKSMDANIKEDE